MNKANEYLKSARINLAFGVGNTLIGLWILFAQLQTWFPWWVSILISIGSFTVAKLNYDDYKSCKDKQ